MSAIHHHFEEVIKEISELIYLYKQENDVKQLKQLVKLCDIRDELEGLYHNHKVDSKKQLVSL